MKKINSLIFLFVGNLLITLSINASNSNPAVREYIGTFTNKSVNSETGDCLGREVEIWKENGVLSGVLKAYEGNCSIAGVPLTKIKFDPKSGNLSFNANGPMESLIWIFVGKVAPQQLSGSLDLTDKKTGTKSPNYENLILEKVVE